MRHPDTSLKIFHPIMTGPNITSQRNIINSFIIWRSPILGLVLYRQVWPVTEQLVKYQTIHQVENVGVTLNNQNLLLVKICTSGKVRFEYNFGEFSLILHMIYDTFQVWIQGSVLDRKVGKIQNTFSLFLLFILLNIIYFDHQPRWRNTCP